MKSEHWWRRRVFVTGCTGLLGGWLTDWLVAQGADVVGLVRDHVPGSNFYRLGLAAKVTTVRGSLEDAALLERILNEYEIDGILTDKSDALNLQRRRDYFLDSVRGKRHLEVIRAAIEQRKNILVAGSTGSGKTTFINAVLDELAWISQNDRVLIIEDTPELQCNVKNSVALLAVGRVSMLDCLSACMRLKPTRIVVGEVRGAEALSMLKAWNTGHPGGAASVHANDAHGALIRLESLVAEATAAPQQQLIAEAVNVVVFVDSEPSIRAGRKVREVAVVTGYIDGDYKLEYV